MATNRARAEVEKRAGIREEEIRRKKRRRGDIESMLTGHKIVRARVTGHGVSLFLDSHTAINLALRASDVGRLEYSWRSLDTLKTDDDFKG